MRRDGTEVTCAARTIYVVIATDGSGKREIPPLIADRARRPGSTDLTPAQARPSRVSATTGIVRPVAASWSAKNG